MFMIKKIILLVLFFCLISCQENSLDLKTTKWLVYDVIHNNKKLTVFSKNDSEVVYEIGENVFELIKFNIIDSTVLLPGLNSKRTKYRFDIKNDSIKLTLESIFKKSTSPNKYTFKTDNYSLKIKDKPDSRVEKDTILREKMSNVYQGTYKIKTNFKKTEIRLTSKNTVITMESTKSLIQKTIDGTLEPPKMIYYLE